MEFLLALVIFAVAVLGLAAGLLITGRPPQGSCGGLACVGGGQCDGCPRHASDSGEAQNG